MRTARYRIMAAVMLSFFLFSCKTNWLPFGEADVVKKDNVGQASPPATNQEKTQKTIFDYKTELMMTSTQEDKIRQYLSDLNKQSQVLNTKLAEIHSDVRDLIKTEGDQTRLESKIRESFQIKASMMIVDIETARKVNLVLTAEQLRKWDLIKSGSSR